MKRKETRALQSVLDQVLQETGLAPELDKLRLYQAWDALVGAATAAHCTQRSFREGALRLKVDSSVVRSQLQMQKDVLLVRMNQVLLQAQSHLRITELILY